MSTAVESLRRSVRAIGRGLVEPRLYLLLAVSLGAWSLAYQYKTAYTVDLGGPGDDAYVSGFNAKEHNPSLDYRWSGPRSSVRLPGIGNEPVTLTVVTVGFRPSGEAPSITLEARGQSFSVQTHAEPYSDTFEVRRGDAANGNFELNITSPVFSPPGDPRRLGVIVDRVTVAPRDYGLRPLVVPPPDTLAQMLAGLTLGYLTVLVATGSLRGALGISYVLSLVATALVVYARPQLGLLAPQLPSLGAWGVATAALGRVALAGIDDRRLTMDDGDRETTRHAPIVHRLSSIVRPHTPIVHRPSSIVHRPSAANLGARLGSAAFAGAFLLRFGGATYPQFLTSDLLLHVHNVQKVLGGQWVFPGYLPDGTTVPYPPALYALLSPLAWLLGSADDTLGIMLKWSASFLDSTTCLALAWVGTRLWSGGAGGLAALAYALSPAPFDLISAGNYSNLFGQSVLNLTLLFAIMYLARAGGPAYPSGSSARVAALMTAGFLLTVLGHYGMMLAALAIMGLFAVWALLAQSRPGQARGPAPTGSPAWWVLGAFAVALAGSFAVYYWRFWAEMWAQLSGVLARAGGAGTGSTGTGQRLSPGSVLRKLGEKAGLLTGALEGLSALFGAALAQGLGGAARALLFCWLGASAVFALLDQTLGDAIRWYYLGAAAIALLSGRYFGLLLWRGRAARWLTALSLAAMLAHLLAFWVGDLIFARYH